MFERFTDQSRRVVVLAQEEARVLDHPQIEIEHLLLGLAAAEQGSASAALSSLGLSLDQLREDVEAATERGAPQPPQGHMPFTPRAKKVMDLALREALQLGHNYIGTEHLLLAVIREVRAGNGGAVTDVLARHGVDAEHVRAAVTELLPEPTPSVFTSPPAGTEHVVRIRLSDDQYGPCRSAAAAAGQPLHEWAREQLLQATQHDPDAEAAQTAIAAPMKQPHSPASTAPEPGVGGDTDAQLLTELQTIRAQLTDLPVLRQALGSFAATSTVELQQLRKQLAELPIIRARLHQIEDQLAGIAVALGNPTSTAE